MRDKGFTLIEIMIVVAIISILSVIAVPTMGKYINRANESKLVKTVSEIRTALSVCSAEKNGEVAEDFTWLESESVSIPPGVEGYDTADNPMKLKAGRVEFEVKIDSATGRVFYTKK